MADRNRKSTDPSGSDGLEAVADESVGTFLSTDEDFEALLRTLVLTADEGGIDVRGGWPVVPDRDDAISWDVEIVELERNR